MGRHVLVFLSALILLLHVTSAAHVSRAERDVSDLLERCLQALSRCNSVIRWGVDVFLPKLGINLDVEPCDPYCKSIGRDGGNCVVGASECPEISETRKVCVCYG